MSHVSYGRYDRLVKLTPTIVLLIDGLPAMAANVVNGRYFETHTHIRPFGIVPDGPLLNFNDPHKRG